MLLAVCLLADFDQAGAVGPGMQIGRHHQPGAQYYMSLRGNATNMLRLEDTNGARKAACHLAF